MQRAVPAVGSVTLSSRPDRGLWFETVQLAASLSYLPDGLAWPGVTLARSACLFSTFSLTHLLRLPPRTGIRTRFLPRGNVNTGEKKLPISQRGARIVVTLVTYPKYPCYNKATFCWDPPSRWCRCCITCSTAGKTDTAVPLLSPICPGYCTTDARVFFTNFLLLCLPCGKADYYLSKWQLSERCALFTHGANHVGSFIYLAEEAFWCLHASITYRKTEKKRKSLFLHVRFRWIQLFFYLAQVEADGGDQEEVDKVKKQQKAPCFGC